MYKKISLVLLAFIATISCKKFVDIKPAPDLIETSLVFSNDKTAQSALNGLYTQLRFLNLSITNGGLSLYTSLSADELQNTASTSTVDQFYQNSLLSDNSIVLNNFWVYAYKPIYIANAILEGLSKASTLTDSVKQQIEGEALVIRSLIYFDLVNLFGDVPLVLSTDYRINGAMPRTTTQVIYDKLKEDLARAELILPLKYPSQGKVRANKFVAAALLARVYLYQQEWDKAEKEASTVIGGPFALSPMTTLSNVFKIDNSETIWEIASDVSNTSEGFAFVTTAAKPPYAITSSLINAFETGDMRKDVWLFRNGTTNPYFPNKYKIRSGTPISEYDIVLRLPEQYLIRAEARAQLSKISEALTDLNKVRSRCNLANLSTSSVTTLLQMIEHERRVELFAEWGHRWFDLKRTHRATDVLKPIKGTAWQTTDTLYPIPVSQIQLNPFLTQNPSY